MEAESYKALKAENVWGLISRKKNIMMLGSTSRLIILFSRKTASLKQKDREETNC